MPCGKLAALAGGNIWGFVDVGVISLQRWVVETHDRALRTFSDEG